MPKTSGSTSGRLARKSTSLIAAIAVTGFLSTACSSKPGSSDIVPFVMDDLGACPLWEIADVKKTDGVAQEPNYQIDFTATLTLKENPVKLWEDAKRASAIAWTPACNIYWAVLIQQGGTVPIPEPRVPGFSMSEKYSVSGYAVLVKSENGWQLAQEIRGLSFTPIP
ncbi:hypothetical protein RCH14_004781 [Massilia sp. MP_M2]|uniref:hypothetical protein n=1 Tax=Massilia sp. MP_M2 TaxID=3071713 RepID=UPI00319E7F9F